MTGNRVSTAPGPSPRAPLLSFCVCAITHAAHPLPKSLSLPFAPLSLSTFRNRSNTLRLFKRILCLCSPLSGKWPSFPKARSSPPWARYLHAVSSLREAGCLRAPDCSRPELCAGIPARRPAPPLELQNPPSTHD